MIFCIVLSLVCIWTFRQLWDYSSLVIHPDVEAVVNFPDMFGLNYERVAFEAEDGAKLFGWWVPAKSTRTIVFCHGWASNKGALLSQTWYLALEGFNLFYFDFRGCGDSPKHGPSSLGYYENRDLRAALEYARSRYPEETRKIGIYGLSMGASTSFLVAGQEGSGVSALACEAPFARFYEVVSNYGRIHFRLAKFPLIDTVNLLIWLRSGCVDHKSISPIAVAPRFTAKNFFLFYGEIDELAPPRNGKEILAALPVSPKNHQFWLCPDAEHDDCWHKHPDLYREKLTKFFKDSL